MIDLNFLAIAVAAVAVLVVSTVYYIVFTSHCSNAFGRLAPEAAGDRGHQHVVAVGAHRADGLAVNVW